MHTFFAEWVQSLVPALVSKYKSAKVSTYREQSNHVTNKEPIITEIPFTKEDGICKVKCQINGLPLHFVFDTGASDVALSMVEATFMMKNGYLSKNDVIGNQRYMDANGNVNVGTVINIKNVNFGGLNLNNIRASVVRNQKAPLLLGQSVLARLGKIEIDNAKNVIKITQ
ncbi:MAG: retropepsin-like aspartic protease [Candidatus Limisoma sp.]|nr:retropepsin-like aspartic protease [Candidatus Limisoma sp.]